MPERDKDATKARLIEAVGALIAREGFSAVRINAVAREAGVDKVLIYRYFDTLSGLLAAFGEEGDFWWSIEELMAPPLPGPADGGLAACLARIFDRHVDFLRRRPVTLEIIAWEMSSRNELTIALETVRERRSRALIEAVAAHLGRDAAELQRRTAPAMALLGAGANYLAARARHVRTFSGLALDEEADWQALSHSVRMLLAGLDTAAPDAPWPEGRGS